MAILGVIAIVFTTVKRPIVPVLYVVFFPLVLAFWLLPKFLIGLKSWIVFLGTTNVMASFFRRFTQHTAISAMVLLSMISVVVVPPEVVIYLAIVCLGLAGIYLYYRYMVNAFKGSEFLPDQLDLLRRTYGSKLVQHLTSVDPDLREPDVTAFDSTQQTKFLTSVSLGLLGHKLLYFWAFQLDRYRRSTIPALFEALSYAWLVSATVLLVTFVNLGIDRADPSAFSGPEVGVLRMMRYTIASLYGGEINGVIPLSPLAELSALIGMAGIGLVVLSVVIGLIRSRWSRSRDHQFADTLQSIKGEASAFQARFESEFAVTPEEAERRLVALSHAFSGAIAAMSRAIPAEFLDSE